MPKEFVLKNKQVLIVTRSYPSLNRSYPTGGVEKLLQSFVRDLAVGNTCRIVTMSDNSGSHSDEIEASPNITIFRFRRLITFGKYLNSGAAEFLNSLYFFFSAIPLLCKQKYDVVLAWDHTSYVLCILGRFFKKDIFVFWHDYLGINWLRHFGLVGLPGMTSEFLAKIFSKNHIFLSDYLLKKVFAFCGNKNLYIYKLKFEPPAQHVVRPKEKIILVVSRLVKYKNVDLALRLFQKVHLTDPSWRMIVVGAGPVYSDLHHLSEELNVSNAVEFISNIDDKDLVGFYQKAKVFLHMSDVEGYCLSISEALQYGCKVIAKPLSALISIYGDRVVYLHKKNYEKFADIVFSS